MERELVLSSYDVNNIGNNKPESFVTQYDNALNLDQNKRYVVGLNRIINMSFTWFNIAGGYNNRLIKCSSDGGKTFNDITFPAGVWNYTDLDVYIKEKPSYKDLTGKLKIL